MRRIQMSYPDGTIHEIEVDEFGYNSKLNIYVLHYFDLTDNQAMYTIIEKRGNKYIKNPNIEHISYNELHDTYEILNLSDLPNFIGCRKKEIIITPTETNDSPQYNDIDKKIIILAEHNGILYIQLSELKNYNYTSNSTKTINVNGKVYVEITRNELKKIQDIGTNKNQEISFKSHTLKPTKREEINDMLNDNYQEEDKNTSKHR